jgi:hypothetical protein
MAKPRQPTSPRSLMRWNKPAALPRHPGAVSAEADEDSEPMKQNMSTDPSHLGVISMQPPQEPRAVTEFIEAAVICAGVWSQLS